MKNNPSSTSWKAARQGMLRVAGATAIFALWHSLLCSRAAKDGAQKLLGERDGRAWYRLFFNAQSALTTGALLLVILRAPHRTLYQRSGWARLASWIGQAASLTLALRAVGDIGPKRFLGVQSVGEWREDETIQAPEAQGPPLTKSGGIEVTGVYRWSRHPLEWLPMLLLWLTPTLKTNWLAFNLLGTIYSYVGARHEEKRLLQKLGAAFQKYQQQVSFWVSLPRPQSTLDEDAK